MSFGDLLNKYKDEHNLTATQLAKIGGISANCASGILKGGSPPKIKTVIAFVRFFRISWDELIEAVENEEAGE
jgi:transcriptional regulator with XRE-family HTH domain